MNSGRPLIDFSKYKLFVFDWDGTLLDSQDSYMTWDQLFVKNFYGVDWPLENFYELANNLKSVGEKGGENAYFRFLDKKFGNGETPMNVIWERIYSLAPAIQARNNYREGAVEFLLELKNRYDAKIALCTSSERRDIEFYSSGASRTALVLNPLTFFDCIVTLDDVRRPKPHPEPYLKVMEQCGVNSKETLVFEDSIEGATSAERAGAEVVFVGCDFYHKDSESFVMRDKQ